MRAIDLFAGWGGMSAGAESAGARVVWAANHNPVACAAHAAAFPDGVTVCQDLTQADWSTVPVHDLLLAAPECQGHSSASQPGRRLYHAAMRATAWAVIDCVDHCEPRAVVVENVPQFRRWRLYPQWRAALAAIGYHVTEQLVTASDWGVAQRRTRLFVVATKATIGRFEMPRGRRPGEPEPAAGPHVDWAAGKWRRVSDASRAVQDRVAAAQARHGARCFSQHVTGHKGVGLGEPLRTITTKDQWVAVDGPRYRPLSIRETARIMGFDDSYTGATTATRGESIRGLGNAVCPPVAAAIVRRLGGMLSG